MKITEKAAKEDVSKINLSEDDISSIFIAGINFAQYWTPVEEDLPPIDKNHIDDKDFGDGWSIVVLLNAGTYNTGRYNHIKKEWRKLDYFLVFNVVSWRYITII